MYEPEVVTALWRAAFLGGVAGVLIMGLVSWIL